MKTTTYPSGLRYLFILGGVGALLAGLPSVFLPSVVVDATGLSPQTVPVIQQAGALALGFCVAAFLCWRAVAWSEVRISLAASFVVFVLTAVGAFYYVILLGVATPGLIAILLAAIVMTLGFGFYLFQSIQSVQGENHERIN
jgi:hypothetical protein